MCDNRPALNYLLAEGGGICVETNTSCCTWINNATGEVEVNIKKLWSGGLTAYLQPEKDLPVKTDQLSNGITQYHRFPLFPAATNNPATHYSLDLHTHQFGTVCDRACGSHTVADGDNTRVWRAQSWAQWPTNLRLAGKRFCPSTEPPEDAHIQQEVATKDDPLSHSPQEWEAGGGILSPVRHPRLRKLLEASAQLWILSFRN